MIDTALPHNAICGVPGFDFSVNCKILVADRTVPDVMIAFPMAYKRAAVRGQDIPYFLFVLGHYGASLSCRVAWNRRETGGCVGLFSWIRSAAV